MMSSPNSPAAAPTHAPISVRAGVLWTALGNALAAAAQWGIVAGLAHLGSPQAVGVYALALALTAPLFLLAGLQLRSVQATDTQEQTPFAAYLGVRLGGIALALLATLLLTPLYPQAAGVLLLVAVAKSFEGASDLIYGVLQRAGRLDWVARSVLGRSVCGLLLLLLLFTLTRSVAAAAAGVGLANLGWLLLYDLPRLRRVRPGARLSPDWRGVMPVVRVAWPLGVVMGLVSLSSAIPRLVLEGSGGAALLGVFAALSYVTVAGSVVVTAVGTALTTPLARRYAAGDRAGFLRLSGLLLLTALLVGGLITLAGALFGHPLLTLLYGARYAGEERAFVWLLLAGAVTYAASCAGFAVTAARRFLEQLPLFALVTLLLYLLCRLLIPGGGLTGAALATLIAAAAQLLGSAVIVLRALRPSSLPAPTAAPNAATTAPEGRA